MKNLLLVVASVFVMLTFSQPSLAVGETIEAPVSKVMVAARKPVNLNSAEAKEIADNLVGIGLKKAETIVDYRKTHGAFKTIEDLALIKGIGVKTIAKNEGFILLN